MNILNIIQCANLGGMERSNLLSLRALQVRGHSFNMLSLNPIGALSPLLKDANISAIGLEYSGWFGVGSFFDMRKRFFDSHYDAILMTGHNLTATLALMGHPAKRKILAIHYHHFESKLKSWRWPIIYAAADSVFDHITFVSNFVRKEALSIRPTLATKSSVVQNPFEIPPRVKPSERLLSRQRLGIDRDLVVIGNAGWLIPRKRFDVFLQVAAVALRKRQDLLFMIAGDGPEQIKLKTLSKELGIDRHVRFLGWQSDLADFYRSIDVLLFNSDFDALGRTPLEAAAYGRPVVASVIQGGQDEAFDFRDQYPAMLIKEHDIQTLADAVLALAEDSDKREMIGEILRRQIVEYGCIEKHADIIEQLLMG